MAEDIKERVLRYLNDAHAVEVGAVGSLQDLAAEATNADLRAAVQEHLTQTQSQADRLEARIKALGGDKAQGKGLLNTLIGKGSDLLNAFHDKEDKQTQDTIKAYALEHFEVGMYTSLKAFADSVGDTETAQLADTILNEEQLAGERLLRLIPQIAKAAVGNTTNVSAGAV